MSLPARDGLRTIELPLDEAFVGLESLASEESASLIIEEDELPTSVRTHVLEPYDDDSSNSELSVVFRGAHHSERPPHPDHAPAVRWSGKRGSVRPPSNPAESWAESAESAEAEGAESGEVELDVEIPQPPRLPGMITPPPPAPRAAEFGDELDFDDEVDTTVMPSRFPESMRPLPPPPIPLTRSLNAPTLPPARALNASSLPLEPPALPLASAYRPATQGDDSLRPVALRPSSERPRSVVAARRPQRSPWLALAAGSVFGGAAIAAAGFWVETERGELVIDVADQQCGAVESVEIFVDEELVCTSAPCSLQVSTGSHIVRAQAEGYALTEAQAVLVDSKVPTLHRVQFGASSRTGIEVRSKHSGYTLYLDGKLIGELPQRLTGLSAGEHMLLVSGGEQFYAEEKKIELQADQLLVLENIELKPRTGLLEIAGGPELEGATVLLDGKRIQLPFTKDMDASKRYRLVARKAGFEDFETSVEFNAGERKRRFDLQLTPKAASDEASGEPVARRASSGARAGAAALANTSSKASGRATLNLTSDPPSNVLLDGKPIGRTPRMGVEVSSGTHTVLFVHPTLGRARASAKLDPGQSKTLRARF